MSELLKRVLVAIVGIPLAISIIYLGGYYFLSFILILSSLTLWEFFKLAERKNVFPHKNIGIIANLTILFLFSGLTIKEPLPLIIPILLIFTIVILISEMRSKKPNAVMNVSSTIAGIIYISLSFCSLLGIRQFFAITDGNLFGMTNLSSASPATLNNELSCAWLLLCALIAIWICDSAAYFFGLQFGKHKLAPRISPKKSWEGAIAGVVFGIASFVASAAILIPQLSVIHTLIFGAIVGTLGQLGDLAESQLKRDAGIKDSSAILPGHGGMLDRFDSILFVMPAIYIYLIILNCL